MYSSMLFLHVVGATLLGFYVLLPFLTGKISNLSGQSQESYVGLISTFNRVGQFALIAAFVTGGAMVSKAGLSVSWMITSIVLLLAIGALSGIMGANIKRVIVACKSGNNTSAAAGKVITLSWVNAVIVIATLYVMVFRW